MTYAELKNDLLKNDEVRKEYDALETEYEIKRAVLEARRQKDLTQQQLADLTGIDRADISKLENGNTNPSIALLKRIADGLDMKLKIEFVQKST